MEWTKKLAHAWNAFNQADQDATRMRSMDQEYGGYYSNRQDRPRYTVTNERNIVNSIYNRIAVDASSVSIRHTRHDDQDRYLEDIPSSLNDCLTLSANVDQIAPHLIQDAVHTMIAAGTVAVAPIDTTLNPEISGGYDITSLRVGTVVAWFPRHVKLNLYNDRKGFREDIIFAKETVAIVENPFYAVMNEPNSTLARLQRKLTLLDQSDEEIASGKIDIIIQLPYQVRSETRRTQAQQRTKDIEFQLTNSKYGIAYADATEKITQLNRPVDNNLPTQVESLTNLVFGQLGMTPEIMNGTAEEEAMLNYLNRVIEPIIERLCLEMKRKFLTKTARTQRQSIDYFRDPFKLVPLSELAEIVDKFTRAEVATSNELRGIIGWKPSQEPKADELRNSNMPDDQAGPAAPDDGTDPFAAINTALDEVFADLGADG